MPFGNRLAICFTLKTSLPSPTHLSASFGDNPLIVFPSRRFSINRLRFGATRFFLFSFSYGYYPPSPTTEALFLGRASFPTPFLSRRALLPARGRPSRGKRRAYSVPSVSTTSSCHSRDCALTTLAFPARARPGLRHAVSLRSCTRRHLPQGLSLVAAKTLALFGTGLGIH